MFRGSGGGDPEGLRLFLDRETPASSRGRLTLRSARVLRAVDMSVLSLSNGLSGCPSRMYLSPGQKQQYL